MGLGHIPGDGEPVPFAHLAQASPDQLLRPHGRTFPFQTVASARPQHAAISHTAPMARSPSARACRFGRSRGGAGAARSRWPASSGRIGRPESGLPRRQPGGPTMAANHADIHIPPECREMIRDGALVAVNTSGGKDSQTMTILLSRIVPRDQIVAVHAPLVDVEWPGTVEFIRATLPAGMPLILAPVASGKTLLDSIEERGRFPSPKVRWCTSSLKRGPIQRELRRHLKANPRFGGGWSTPWACAPRRARRAHGSRHGGATTG